MCSIYEFIEEISKTFLSQEIEPVERGSIWIDKKGYKCQVLKSSLDSVQVIKETNFKYIGRNGFQKFGEFETTFFLRIFEKYDMV